jgi:hypothetical protein
MRKKSFLEYEIHIFQLRSALQYKHARGEFESLTDKNYRISAAKRAKQTSELGRYLLFKLIDKEI